MSKILRSHWQVLLVLAALLLIAIPLLAECYSYPNSRPAYIYGQSVCAYTGSGCTECVEGSGSCITNGSGCTPFQKSPNP
jgi:hypothetical protein